MDVFCIQSCPVIKGSPDWMQFLTGRVRTSHAICVPSRIAGKCSSEPWRSELREARNDGYSSKWGGCARALLPRAERIHGLWRGNLGESRSHPYCRATPDTPHTRKDRLHRQVGAVLSRRRSRTPQSNPAQDVRSARLCRSCCSPACQSQTATSRAPAPARRTVAQVCALIA